MFVCVVLQQPCGLICLRRRLPHGCVPATLSFYLVLLMSLASMLCCGRDFISACRIAALTSSQIWLRVSLTQHLTIFTVSSATTSRSLVTLKKVYRQNRVTTLQDAFRTRVLRPRAFSSADGTFFGSSCLWVQLHEGVPSNGRPALSRVSSSCRFTLMGGRLARNFSQQGGCQSVEPQLVALRLPTRSRAMACQVPLSSGSMSHAPSTTRLLFDAACSASFCRQRRGTFHIDQRVLHAAAFLIMATYASSCRPPTSPASRQRSCRL